MVDVCACAVVAIRHIEGVMGRECSDMLWDVATVTGPKGTWLGLWADGGWRHLASNKPMGIRAAAAMDSWTFCERKFQAS